MISLCIATNYALVSVPNVKVMDFIVFIGGFCFGPVVGALMGILTWGVYGVINPYGFVLPVWLATMFSEAIYGLAGGFLGRILPSTGFTGQRLQLSVFFGATACILTLIYDSVVNIVYALVFNVPLIAALIFGIPFYILHLASNALLFSGGTIPIIRIISKLTGSSVS